MLKTYRKGFVAAYMISIGVVLAGVFTAVGITMHQNDYAELKNTMRHVLMQMDMGAGRREDAVPADRPDKKIGGDIRPNDAAPISICMST